MSDIPAAAEADGRHLVAIFDPAGLYARADRRRRRRRAADLPRRLDPSGPPPMPAEAEEWNEFDAVPLGGLLHPIELYLHANPPASADSLFVRRLGAYLAVRLGAPRPAS